MPTTTVVDWSKKPEPWRTIGPEFRVECESIAAGAAPPQPPSSRGRKPQGRNIETGRELRIRRTALRLSGTALGLEAGYTKLSASVTVSDVEQGRVAGVPLRRIQDALDRLEAEQKTRAA